MHNRCRYATCILGLYLWVFFGYIKEACFSKKSSKVDTPF